MLAVAATAKLAAGVQQTAAAFAAMGVRPRLARAAALGVPAVEVLVAAALVGVPAAAWPGVLAAALMGAFTVVVVAVAEPGAPCPCFGASHGGGGIGGRAVVRNGVLAALGVLATVPVDGAGVAQTALALAALGTITAAVTRWAGEVAEDGPVRQRPRRRSSS